MQESPTSTSTAETEEGEGAIPDLEDENVVYAQVTKKRQKDKKAEIDPEKAKQEIAELECLIEKANVTQDLHFAAPPAEEAEVPRPPTERGGSPGPDRRHAILRVRVY